MNENELPVLSDKVDAKTERDRLRIETYEAANKLRKDSVYQTKGMTTLDRSWLLMKLKTEYGKTRKYETVIFSNEIFIITRTL